MCSKNPKQKNWFQVGPFKFPLLTLFFKNCIFAFCLSYDILVRAEDYGILKRIYSAQLSGKLHEGKTYGIVKVEVVEMSII